MAGSKEAARKAAATMRAKFGEDYFKRIGKTGGASGDHERKGFGSMDHERVVEIAHKAAARSAEARRKRKANNET
jgi:hypothetical protein